MVDARELPLDNNEFRSLLIFGDMNKFWKIKIMGLGAFTFLLHGHDNFSFLLE